MYKKSGLLFLHSQTAIHVGAGGGCGVIDQPVQREVGTKFPVLAARGVRGAVRQFVSETYPAEEVRTIFGSNLQELEGRQSGSIAFSDAKILLFPICQADGVFAWITCPLALRRVMQDSGLDEKIIVNNLINLVIKENEFVCLPDSLYDCDNLLMGDRMVYRSTAELRQTKSMILAATLQVLAPLVFMAWPQTPVWERMRQKFYGQGISDVVLLNDQTFADLTHKTSQIESRIKVESETKKVQNKLLWNEETLPPEMLLYTVVAAAPLCLQQPVVDEKVFGNASQADSVLNWLKNALTTGYLQFGAGASLGRGYFAVGCGW